MRLRRTFLLLTIVCFGGLGTTMAKPPDFLNPIEIVSVIADVDGGTLMIFGANFDNGSDPVVTLGGVAVDAAEIVATPTMITGPLPPVGDGDHLLAVSTGSGQTQNVSLSLTIGAVGATGPRGPRGLQGEPGPASISRGPRIIKNDGDDGNNDGIAQAFSRCPNPGDVVIGCIGGCFALSAGHEIFLQNWDVSAGNQNVGEACVRLCRASGDVRVTAEAICVP